jgi:predicted ArsR family transcriptional regulator
MLAISLPFCLLGDVIDPGGESLVTDATVPLADGSLSEGPARSRVLEMIATEGPVSAGELAARLGVTPAAVRRHLAGLECDGLVAVHEAGHGSRARGRPARRYVTTARGQAGLGGAYADVAIQALRFLQVEIGDDAVDRYAVDRYADLRSRYASRIDGSDVTTRAEQLASILTGDGYAATVRPVPGGRAVQLCQGHCPVQHVAREFPQLCDAEARAFSELLGSHVQRLATIAGGGHACTTNIPLAPRLASTRPDYPITDKD